MLILKLTASRIPSGKVSHSEKLEDSAPSCPFFPSTAWCITARAAVSLPQKMPYFLAEEVEYLGEGGKDSLARYRAQPSTEQVTRRMDSELANLEELIKNSGHKSAARGKVGEWDADRKRWLLQWVRDADMV